MDNRKSSSDISFTFALLTTLIVAWVYLFNLIVDMGLKNPASLSLFSLSILHYILFLFAGSTLILLYCNGIEYLGLDKAKVPNKLMDTKSTNQEFLFKFWFPTLLLSFLVVIATLAIDADHKVIFLASLIFAISLTSYVLFKILGKNQFILGGSLNLFLIPVLVVGYFVYVFCISYLAAGVSIKTDKEFYNANEKAIVSIDRKGYIFLPIITSVNFVGRPVYKINPPTSFQLDLKKEPAASYRSMPYLEVSFVTQIAFVKRNNDFFLRIAADDGK